MAANILEHDNMVSVHELPWHGLGIVLEDYVSVKEAQEIAGLTWNVERRDLGFQNGDSFSPYSNGEYYAMVRDDINLPLGIVKGRYVPYQNDEMFGFMEEFCNFSNSKIETCGSLGNGAIVWALANAKNPYEVVKNDEIERFFLFKNSFDGTSPMLICYTDVRVVCSNTLNAAIKSAENIYKVKHTHAMGGRILDIKNALRRQFSYEENILNIYKDMAKFEMTETKMSEFLDNHFNKDAKESTRIKNKKEQILELVENGAGADIPGVKGNAYGFYQAITEYYDHFAPVYASKTKNEEESRFSSIMFGNAKMQKEKVFSEITDMMYKAA